MAVWAPIVGAQAPVPLIYQPLVPSAAPPGGPTFTLTVRGTAFLSGALVYWDGAPLMTTFVSQSELNAQVPASDLVSAHTAEITVHNPGVEPASNFIYFQVADPVSRLQYVNASGSPAWLGAPGGNLAFPYSVVAGDFFGAATPSLAMPFSPSGTPIGPAYVNFYAGKGDGTFSLSTSSEGIGYGAGSVAVGDFAGTGRLDLAVGGQTNAGLSPVSGALSVLLNNGDGTFSPAHGSPYTVGSTITGIAVGDFNRDGKLDLAIATSQGVYILLGNGDGSFTPLVSGPLPFVTPYGLTVADLNGDGILDIAAADFGSHIQIFLGKGDGTFAPGPKIPLQNYQGRTTGVAAADVNGDGNLDLLVANGGVKDLTVLLGDGHGNFTEEPSPVAGCCESYANLHILGWVLRLGDFLANGRLDVAVEEQNVNSGVSECYLDTYLGNNDGTFVPSDYSVMLPECPTGDFAVADFNGDGLLDFATAAMPQNYYNVLLTQSPSGPAPDFSISAVDPSTASLAVQPGGAVTYQLGITSLNGFTGLVSVTCGSLPPDTTCGFQNNIGTNIQIVIPPAPAQFSGVPEFYPYLTLQTAAPGAASGATSGFHGRAGIAPPYHLATGARLAGFAVAGGLFLALLFISAIGGSRRKVPHLLAIAAAALVVGAASCGGGPATQTTPPPPPPPSGGTPLGTYTVNVNVTALPGTPKAFSHSFPVTLTVQAQAPAAAAAKSTGHRTAPRAKSSPRPGALP